MKERRVVTGHTLDGKATVASDTAVDAITIGPWHHRDANDASKA